MRTLRDLDVYNKKVLVRCDFNVPLSEEGVILDDFRIKQTIPTIKYLIENEAKIILMSHLGRPSEKKSNLEPDKYSLKPISRRLEELLNKKIYFLNDCIGESVQDAIQKSNPGDVILLENLRFHKEEEENKDAFARDLSRLGDIYINDAFGASHRSHASIVGVPGYLISGSGFLLEKEIAALSHITQNPQKPLVAIIGGAKVKEKAGLINNISEVADFILIGGLIQNEIKAKNIQMKYPEKIVEPVDDITGKDIGSKTVNIFKEKILIAKTVFFNGVLGQVEKEEFSIGTKEILKAIVQSPAYSVVGGGDMTAIINQLGLIEKFNHVSTGGGAMIEFLSGEKLPGIEALEKNQEMFTA